VNWLLIAVLGIPALGALAAATTRSERGGQAVGTAAAALAFVAAVALGFGRTAPATGAIRPWHEIDASWVPGLRMRFHLGVDGISYPLVVLTALLTLLCCLYTLARVEDVARGRLLIALLLAVQVGISGVFLALDLVLFFVFFEVVLLPMYAVIAGWGGPDRRRASTKFLLYTLLGSELLLVGVVLVVVQAGTGDLVALTAGRGAALPYGVQLIAFILLGLAFAVKSPLWPLHTWLPDAHTEAPTAGSVILAGVLLKMGTYGLLRVSVGVLPDAARRMSGVLGVLAVTAILVGSLVCLAQTELKRLIAYSSVGHMGFVLLGIASMTATGFTAALVGNIAHGIITGLLFFLAGAVKHRTHTGELAELGGLRERVPWLAGLLGFAAIASLGLPGLAGFWGEAFAVVAALRRGDALWITLAVLAAVGGALTAAYFLRLLRRVTHGAASPAVDAVGVHGGSAVPGGAGAVGSGAVGAGGLGGVRLRGAEIAAWAPLVALALAVGLVPGLVLSTVAAPVAELASAVIR
jgi:NADH-quinone oxidoreductase subunit M